MYVYMSLKDNSCSLYFNSFGTFCNLCYVQYSKPDVLICTMYYYIPCFTCNVLRLNNKLSN